MVMMRLLPMTTRRNMLGKHLPSALSHELAYLFPSSPLPFPSSLSRLYVQFRFKDGIERQFNALQKGFHELIPPHLLKDFDERELELLISGLGKVDVDDWRANTRLKNCNPETNTIKWFWKVSSSLITSSLHHVYFRR